MKAFEKAVFNPSGESVVLGNFNSILVFSRASRDARWERSCVKAVPNLYSVTAAAWKHDGSRVAVGSLCGVVDLYDSYIRRQLYRGEFEFTHVSPSQVRLVSPPRQHHCESADSHPHHDVAGHCEATQDRHADRPTFHFPL